MKIPEIVTTVVAVYGAVVSTVVAVMQFAKERIRVRVTVGKNRQMVGDPRYANTVLTELTVTNIGHHPLQLERLEPFPSIPARLVWWRPKLTLDCHVKSLNGQYIVSFWPQVDLDFSTIDYWAAWDSSGGECTG